MYMPLAYCWLAVCLLPNLVIDRIRIDKENHMARQSKFMNECEDILSLEDDLNRLALESSIMLDIIDTFKSIVPKLATKLSSIFNTTNTLNIENSRLQIPLFEEFLSLSKELDKEISSLNYIDAGNILVSVPEGFKGNLVEYNNTLLAISKTIYVDTIQALGDYHVALSSFITNKESQTSIKDYKDFYNRVSRAKEHVVEKLNKFSNNGTNSRAYLKTVIDRMADIKELTDITDKLFTNKSLADLNTIKESVFQIVSLLDIITEQTAKQDISKVSKAAASSIADGGYAVAEQVELVSAFYYRCMVSLQTTVNIYRQLKKKNE